MSTPKSLVEHALAGANHLRANPEGVLSEAAPDLLDALADTIDRLERELADADTANGGRIVEIATLKAEVSRLERERDEAVEKLGLANIGSLPLLYDIRRALGWNDKTNLNILADGVRRVRRALATWDAPEDMELEEIARLTKQRVRDLEEINEASKRRIEELLEELHQATEEEDDHQ